MPIEHSCACGARLKAGDETAGKAVTCSTCGAIILVPALPAAEDKFRIIGPNAGRAQADGGMKRCPYCGGRAPGEADRCPHCNRRFVPMTPAASDAERPVGENPPSDLPVKPFPWEILLVIVVIGIDMAFGAMNASRISSPMLAGAFVADGAMILGLVLRATWGWWLTVVLLILRIGMLAMTLPGARDDTSFGTALLGGNALAVLLLIVSAMRDSYSKR